MEGRWMIYLTWRITRYLRMRQVKTLWCWLVLSINVSRCWYYNNVSHCALISITCERDIQYLRQKILYWWHNSGGGGGGGKSTGGRRREGGSKIPKMAGTERNGKKKAQRGGSTGSGKSVADPGGGSGRLDPPTRLEEFIAFSIIHSKTVSRIHRNTLFRA